MKSTRNDDVSELLKAAVDRGLIEYVRERGVYVLTTLGQAYRSALAGILPAGSA